MDCNDIRFDLGQAVGMITLEHPAEHVCKVELRLETAKLGLAVTSGLHKFFTTYASQPAGPRQLTLPI